MDLVGTPAALRRWTIASLVANMGLVVTGGLVRITGSGLGCSTWPQCEPGSYTPHGDAPLHAYIEFGNRLLTFVLAAVAIGTFVAAWRARDAAGRPRRHLRGLALAAGLGIPAQAVIGGLSVLTTLNPWVVGLHMVVSVALIVLCVLMVHDAFDVGPVEARPLIRRLVLLASGLGLLAVLLGIVVTGAGPNSGDGGAARSGLDPLWTARIHSLTVWAVVATTVVLLWLVRRDPSVRRAAVLLLVVELLQGAVGYAQYFLGLPPALVALHMLGTASFAAALANLWWLTRTRDQNSSGSTAAAMNTIAR